MKRMMTTTALILAVLFRLASEEAPENPPQRVELVLEVLPSLQIPVGALGGIVQPTGGLVIDAEARLSTLPWLSAGVTAGYAPAVVGVRDWLHTIMGGGIAQVAFRVLPFLEVGGALGGGYGWSSLVSGTRGANGRRNVYGNQGDHAIRIRGLAHYWRVCRL